MGVRILLFFLICLLFSGSAFGYNQITGIESGDRADIQYSGRIQGEDDDFDSGVLEDTLIQEGQFIVGFYEGLLGMKVGETKDIIVTPDKGYTDPSHNLYGETLVFTTTIQQITFDISENADDIDDDGIPNGEDDDIDGDGIPNGEDDDIDGDGILNGDDDDIDGDGILNGEDDDMDGDGILNGDDDDKNGNGIFDSDESEDDQSSNSEGADENLSDLTNPVSTDLKFYLLTVIIIPIIRSSKATSTKTKLFKN